MSKTFLRGLDLLETVDRHGPLTVTELARRIGVDKAVVSRTVAAAETDGWLSRVDGRIGIGPRAVLLGHGATVDRAARRAEDLVHAVAGVTGHLCHAYTLVGANAAVLAAAGGRGPLQTMPTGLAAEHPVWATAAGRAILAQLPAADLDRLLPAGPYPDAAALAGSMGSMLTSLFVPPATDSAADAPGGPGGTAGAAGGRALPRDRGELDALLADIRRRLVAVDPGDIHPELGCVAVPWPLPALPAALACLGPPAELAAQSAAISRVLHIAAAPGATAGAILAVAAEPRG
jgi:IclR family transcriptional regulator, acetate operon repressor